MFLVCNNVVVSGLKSTGACGGISATHYTHMMVCMYALQDALKTRKPDPGATAGRGGGGRIGSTGGTLLTQHLLKTRGKLVSVDSEMDPREAILRHGDKKGDAVSLLTAAYAKTQPKPVFAEPEPEEDEDE